MGTQRRKGGLRTVTYEAIEAPSLVGAAPLRDILASVDAAMTMPRRKVYKTLSWDQIGQLFRLKLLL